MSEYIKGAKELQDALLPFCKPPKRHPLLKKLHFGEMAVFHSLLQLNSEKDNINMSDISDMLGISKPALSQIVNKLEDRGLVERIYSKEDRRAVYLQLTPEGQRLYQKKCKDMIIMSNALVEKVGEEDALTLAVLLQKVSCAIAELEKEGLCEEDSQWEN